MAVIISRSVVILATPVDEHSPNAPLIGWRNLVTLGGITADHELTAFPASNLANPSTAARWQSDSIAVQYVTFDVTSPDPIDYVGIARHNLGSAGVNVSVEIPDEGSPGDWIEVFTPVVLAGDAPAILRFDPVFAAQVRLKLVPVATAPRIAVVYIGRLTRLQRGLQPGHVPLPFAASDDIVTGQAESGDYLGRIVTRQALATNAQIQFLNYDWFHANLADFVKAAREIPFFFAWMPADYPAEVGFAWVTGDIRPETSVLREGVVVGLNLQLSAVAL
ncbi:MAG: hypothetical protein K0R27_318 [Xanthobacteraceae bacterium]|jgi:hypothetical protein|nr:hypothetical protein [Xanthobacteraceae bacterium]